MGEHSDNSWPPFGDGFDDEYGMIEPNVYAAAKEMWPEAQALARATLGDSAAGMTLMMKATASVSKVYAAQPQKVGHLQAYLFKSYKRLVLAERRRARLHGSLNVEALRDADHSPASPADELDKKILIEELMLRMDHWTRKVFELRVLGFSYEEIGKEEEMLAASVRNKFNERVKRLTEWFKGDESSAS